MQDLLDLGVVPSEVVDPVPSEEIKVLVPLLIVKIGTFPLGVDLIVTDDLENPSEPRVDVFLVQIVIISVTFCDESGNIHRTTPVTESYHHSFTL